MRQPISLKDCFCLIQFIGGHVPAEQSANSTVVEFIRSLERPPNGIGYGIPNVVPEICFVELSAYSQIANAAFR